MNAPVVTRTTATTTGAAAGRRARASLAQLLLGARLTLAGGPSAWLRTAMTGVGVGLGVALLLVAASTPAILGARDDRRADRDPSSYLVGGPLAPSDTTVVAEPYETTTHGQVVVGLVVRPDGAHPPVPPGLSALPGPGQMMVSPALARLLDGPRGALLAARLPFERVGVIGAAGLAGPHELYVYIGEPRDRRPDAAPGSGQGFRIDHFGAPQRDASVPAVLTMLIIVIVAVLLLPIGAFTAAAVRFGSQARDRQLAAVRLVGADPGMARRIAAGGALAGALAGCAAGVALFAAGRPLAQRVTLFGSGVFAGDIRPSPALAALVLVAVPASAVAITLFSLRRVVIEPLGVVRLAPTTRRRLWWRLAMPAVGIALLLPLHAGGEEVFGRGKQAQLAAGVVLVLVGVTVLLPWVLDAAVRRLGPGPLAWQLAVRRLQLDSATTVRAVAAVAVAVTGAIALQMVFSVAEDRFTRRVSFGPGGESPGVTRLMVETGSPGSTAADLGRALASVPAARQVWAWASGGMTTVAPIGGDQANSQLSATLAVADCASLRRLATLPSCADGDTFLAVPGASSSGGAPPVISPEQLADPTARTPSAAALPGPGTQVRAGGYLAGLSDAGRAWVIPAGAGVVATRPDAPVSTLVLTTPRAVGPELLDTLVPYGYIDVDRDEPDAYDKVAVAAARVDPLAHVLGFERTVVDPIFGQIRMSMYVGIAAVLGMVGASLLVTMVEQLRERRRVLAVLVAFGARRRTLAASVLWQAGVPMVLGVALAVGLGMGLGAALLRMVGLPPSFDWANIATISVATAAVVLGTTAASLPVLYRLMRPDGLRTE
ncbi:ABC transporter permease [Pseudofrankia sp. BMG5.37]|uniref:ABC transporter permease n=1 Tax=Pseudofrankia sp. BMG5.37 TaxID=3050035 RepID=UPI002895C136|nr:ABC transporter permease [Pseudofrankia sp. BMG5.37]MDT3444733.1 ABC transporter permease [Pseudofrankia sp. BMG5.37]